MKKRVNSQDIDEAIAALNSLPQPPVEGSSEWKEIMKWYDTASHMRYKRGIAALANTISRALLAHRQFTQAEPYLKQARQLCEASGEWSDLHLYCLMMLTETEATFGRFDEALAIADIIIRDFSAGMEPGMFVQAYITIGNIYQMRGWLYHASHIFQKVLARKEDLIDVQWLAGAWVNNALILYELKLYDAARDEFNAILKEENLIISPFELAFTHMHLAMVFAQGFKDEKNSRRHAGMCFEICRKNTIKSVESLMLLNEAFNLVALGKYDEALRALQHERVVAMVRDNDTEYGELHNAKADCLIGLGRMDEVTAHLAIAEKGLSHSDTFKHKIRYYETCFRYYSIKGDMEQVVRYNKLLSEALLASTRLEHQMQLMQLNALMKLEQKQNELEIHKLKQAQMQKDIELINQEKAMMQDSIEQRNNLIDDFQMAIKRIEKADMKRAEIFASLKDKINSVKRNTAEMDSYDTKYNQRHQEAVALLRRKYPDITPSEAKIAFMLCSGLSNKEISAITLTTPRNIETQRLNLRKKLKLQPKEYLIEKLQEILNIGE